MSKYIQVISKKDNRVVRALDFPQPGAGTELRRLAKAGSLLKLAHGYFALVPEANRKPNTSWRPTIESVALGVAIADYGFEDVALIGPSAARLHGCYPRMLGTATVAVPKQRPIRRTIAGDIQFVVRDVRNLDLVRAKTEMAKGWVTSVEQTMLDLASDWPRWPVTSSARIEMIRELYVRSSRETIERIAIENRKRKALGEVLEVVDDSR